MFDEKGTLGPCDGHLLVGTSSRLGFERAQNQDESRLPSLHAFLHKLVYEYVQASLAYGKFLIAFCSLQRLSVRTPAAVAFSTSGLSITFVGDEISAGV